jgi:hypothetical protein
MATMIDALWCAVCIAVICVTAVVVFIIAAERGDFPPGKDRRP